MLTQSWDEALLSRTAAEIRRLRKEQGLSAQKVADRTSELGQTVSRTTVADIENGRRKYISVVELLLLAAALNTTPVALLYPGPYAEGVEVEVLPNAPVIASEAAQWFGGNLPNPPAWADTDTYETNMRDISSAFADRQRQLMKQLDDIKQTVVSSQESIARWAEDMKRRIEEGQADGG